MEFKDSVFKRKAKGDRRKGKWTLRLRWRDDAGVWRSSERQFASRTDAIDGKAKFADDIRDQNGSPLRGGPEMTFSQLVEVCKKSFYHAATFESGLKTGGVKSLSTVEAGIKNLNEYFGSRRIRNIDDADLRRYREWRKDRGSQNPSLVRKGIRAEISPSTINRELGICRRMFKFALDRDWVTRDIFRNARVIHKRLEEPRTRVLSHEEIDRLLAACTGKQKETFKRRRREDCKDKSREFDEIEHEIEATNLFMKPAILLAVDAGLRKSEILSLKWSDIDTAACTAHIRRENSKTERERLVGLSDRTIKAIGEIRQFKISDDSFVFVSALDEDRPMTNIKRPWEKVKKLAGLSDIRFHDLRRTASTNAVRDLGFGPEYAAKLLGHAQGSQITMRHYVTADAAARDEYLARLNELHRQQSPNEVSDAEN